MKQIFGREDVEFKIYVIYLFVTVCEGLANVTRPMGIRHGGVGRSAGLELRVMCSWQAITRSGRRAKPALVP